MMDEIDEIPERDLPPPRDPHRLSLSHLAVILTFIFITLIVMLICSKGFDYIASKIWPSTSNSTKPEIITKTGTTRIELPASNKLPTNVANAGNALGGSPTPIVNPNPPMPKTPVEPIPAFPEKINSSSPLSGSETKPAQSDHSDLLTKTQPNPEPSSQTISSTDMQANNPTGMNENKSLEPATVPSDLAETHVEKIENTQAIPSPKLDAMGNKTENHPKINAFEKAILKANANHYTIQILAMHNKKKIDPFLKNHHLKDKVKCCQGEFQGKPWYMLVYGEYSTKEEAQKAILELPADVQKEKPWVRKMAAVQEAIHARK